MSSATRRIISSQDTSTRATSLLAAALASVQNLVNDRCKNRTLTVIRKSKEDIDVRKIVVNNNCDIRMVPQARIVGKIRSKHRKTFKYMIPSVLKGMK